MTPLLPTFTLSSPPPSVNFTSDPPIEATTLYVVGDVPP
jgi:hypothetical protein